MKKQFKYVKCRAGNSGNVNLHFFTVNHTMTCSYSLPRTVNLTVFYSKITLNVPLYIYIYIYITFIYRI